uniref:Uncharacterized protein n=1 Tax=Rhizophora mucronata TaxID=61149 RepID=A0A2P2QGV1_RHIMU
MDDNYFTMCTSSSNCGFKLCIRTVSEVNLLCTLFPLILPADAG